MQNYPKYDFLDESNEKEMPRFTELNYPKNYSFESLHSHKYHQIIVFLNGGGLHNINFKEYNIEANSFHIVATGDLHLLKRESGSSGFVISFKNRFLHKLGYINPNISYHELFSRSRIVNLSNQEKTDFDFLIGELQKRETNDSYLLNLIGTFLTKIAVSFEWDQIPDGNYDPIAIELVEHINQHFKKHLSASDYADLLHTTSTNLQKRAKKFSGKSIRELQEERLLTEAQKLLYQPSANISEIAFELGFKETSHFSNWFKKLTGETPSEYKS